MQDTIQTPVALNKIDVYEHIGLIDEDYSVE